jgi:hypothetical protein
MASGLLTIVANRSGVGWSWDTSDYVAVGKNFANGSGFLDATGLPMTVRPPGLSILLGLGYLIGLSVNLTAQIINGVCAIVLVFSTYRLLQIAKTTKSTALISVAFISFSPALLWQYSMIWSEPPFIALLIVAMVVGLRTMNVVKFLSLTSLFVALFLVRYVGPVFAVTVAICSSWFDRRKLGLIKSVLTNFLILAISLIPVWFWLQRNERIDGTLTGARAPGGGSLIDPLKTFNATIGSWLTANPVEGSIYMSWINYPRPERILGALFIVMLVVLIVNFFRSQELRQGEQSNLLLLSIGIVVLYVAFSAYRYVHFELGPLDNRMMIPIYVPVVLIVALTVDNIKFSSSWLRHGFTTLFVLFIAMQAVSSTNDALTFGRNGRHWASLSIKNLPIHQFVASLPSDSSLMSNRPQQLFAIWQKSSVFNQYQLELAQTAECKHRYFVWYNSTYDDGSPNVEGQPEGASEIYTDESGRVLDLGSCDSDITVFWP